MTLPEEDFGGTYREYLSNQTLNCPSSGKA